MYQSEDTALKTIFDQGLPDFVRLLGCDFGDLESRPTELKDLEPLTRFCDSVWEDLIKNIIWAIEFQSTFSVKIDPIRFVHYAVLLYEKYKKFVNILVICTSEVKKAIEKYAIEFKGFFKITYFLFKEEDGDEKLNTIENKIINNEILTNEDITNLLLLPMMGTKYSTEVQLEKTINLTNRETIKDQEVLDFIKRIQILEVDKFIKDEDKYTELMERINMATNMLRKYDENRRMEGRTEGRREARKEVALRMLSKDVSLDKISEYTCLSIDEINNLSL